MREHSRLRKKAQYLLFAFRFLTARTGPVSPRLRTKLFLWNSTITLYPLHYRTTCTLQNHLYTTEPPLRYRATITLQHHLCITGPPLHYRATITLQRHHYIIGSVWLWLRLGLKVSFVFHCGWVARLFSYLKVLLCSRAFINFTVSFQFRISKQNGKNRYVILGVVFKVFI